MRLNWSGGKAECGGFQAEYENSFSTHWVWEVFLPFGNGRVCIKKNSWPPVNKSEAEAIEAAETALKAIIDPAFWALHKGDVEKAVGEISSGVNEISNDGLQGIYITEMQQRQLITAIIKKHLGGE